MNNLLDDETLRHSLQKIVQRLDPQASLLAAWSLSGGLSAQMMALEIAPSATTTRKLIVRRAGAATLRRNPQAMEGEFAILQLVQQAGVMAPRPLLLDSSATILPTSYMVLEYIEGEPNYAPAAPLQAVAQMAAQLARIHQVRRTELETAALSSLPRGPQRLAARLQPPTQLDERLQEGAVRAALAGFVPQTGGEVERLLHGDFWAGNLLWRGGELVAVIDWEDAALGNPLEDFAIARLDIAWFFGEEALHHFSATYRATVGEGNFQALPYWDLLAALGPMGRLDEWAAVLVGSGRADMTEAHMAAAHRRFVGQALAALKKNASN